MWRGWRQQQQGLSALLASAGICGTAGTCYSVLVRLSSCTTRFCSVVQLLLPLVGKICAGIHNPRASCIPYPCLAAAQHGCGAVQQPSCNGVSCLRLPLAGYSPKTPARKGLKSRCMSHSQALSCHPSCVLFRQDRLQCVSLRRQVCVTRLQNTCMVCEVLLQTDQKKCSWDIQPLRDNQPEQLWLVMWWCSVGQTAK